MTQYPTAYRKQASPWRNSGIQRDYPAYRPSSPPAHSGRSPWAGPSPGELIEPDRPYIDHDVDRYGPSTDYNRGRQAVINHQNRVWRSAYRTPTKAAIRRAAARAALRGAARFIPYVGPVVTAIDIAMWLYWLFNNIECGHGGTPGDIRTCFGQKQLPIGAFITDYVDPGQTHVNFYEFENMNGPYEQWRSVGRGYLNNPWVGDGSDKWTNPMPRPDPGFDGDYARFPWEKVDPFNRAPWDPPTDWAPSWSNAPDWRSNPYRSPHEQSSRGYHPPVNDGWPLGWPQPHYPDPAVWVPVPNGPPIVVPLPPTVPNPPPPVVDPELPPTKPPPGEPKPPRPPRQPDGVWEPDAWHDRKPPKPGEKEEKVTGKLPRSVKVFFHGVTEGMDWISAAFNAIPCKQRMQAIAKGGRAGRGFLTPDEKAQAVYKHWHDIDMNDLIYEVAKQEAIDRVIGALARFDQRTRQKAYKKWGVSPASNPSKVRWAQRGLRDLEKQLKLLPPSQPCGG